MFLYVGKEYEHYRYDVHLSEVNITEYPQETYSSEFPHIVMFNKHRCAAKHHTVYRHLQ